MGALWNQKLEIVAQELAAGRSPEEASEAAGYSAKASSFKSNARKRAQDPKVKARIAELRAPGIAKAEQIAAINTEYVLTRAAKIADVEVPDGEVNAGHVISSLRLIAEIIGAMAPEKHALTDKDGNNLTIDGLMRAIDGRTRGLPTDEPKLVPQGG